MVIFLSSHYNNNKRDNEESELPRITITIDPETDVDTLLMYMDWIHFFIMRRLSIERKEGKKKR